MHLPFNPGNKGGENWDDKCDAKCDGKNNGGVFRVEFDPSKGRNPAALQQ